MNETFNLALGIFEESEFAETLKDLNIFPGEKVLQYKWIEVITPLLEQSKLVLPEPPAWQPVYGGRKGFHTEYLEPMLEEMGEVFRLDPKAEW